jgi:DnaJ-domain-containing protein 1
MSLISRLEYILRSRLNSTFEELFGNEKKRREKEKDNAERSTRYSESIPVDESGPDFDPELQTCYAMLEIPYGSNLEKTRAAWRRLLKKYHPDLYSSDPEKGATAQEISQQLNAAFDKIRNALQAKNNHSS